MMFQNVKPVQTIEEFETQLVEQITEYWQTNYQTLKIPNVEIKKGHKFYKIIVGTSHKGVQLKKGDLMKPAGWATAAKHPRGNVIDGTAQYGAYGPTYLC